MSSGTLGKSNLLANINSILYSAPVNSLATITLNICNRNTTQALVKVAISTNNAPDDMDYIEFNAAIPPFGVLERTGIVVSSPNKLIISSNIADVSAVAYGFEDMV